MSSSFLDLPNDILFNVAKSFQVPDLLAARKTCKHLQAITLSRNVWTTMYKMARSDNGRFVPQVISLVSQTIPGLEHLMWRAHRLDTLWEIGASPHCSPKEIWGVGTAPGYFRNVEIYQGRYLIIQTSPSITIYDLETKHEIFRQETEPNVIFYCRIQRHIVDENTEFYLPFRARSSSGKMMSVLKLNALGVVTVTCDCPALRQASNGYLVIGNEFAIINSVFIIHLPSQKVYPLSVYHPELVLSRGVTFISGEYLLVYSDQLNGELQFNLYRLPDPAVVQAGTPVHPTHRGTLYHSVQILNAFFLSNIALSGSSGSIWMFFIYSNFGQLELLHIVLQLDGHLSFRQTNTSSGLDRPMQSTFLTHSADGKIRVVSQVVVDCQEREWVLYGASVDSEGELSICTSAIDIPYHRCFDILALGAS
ncbi:hypothetical protein BDP27DRAFT_1375140 [Rhodocollybia butyracea]|uniref:F-box domain-containing protein n=1 Tax=Rhodocollybia butyracea TaxID=206335 RepID=A0A9P5P5G8_9AGAR|nr:hypothetical protein BDP27DRAFT_1375140 [Rhodocollybia butyracea]